MVTYRQHPMSIFVLYVTCLHYMWAILLFTEESVAKTTTIAAMRDWFPRPYSMIAFMIAASCALWSLFDWNKWRAAVMMIPQQFLLTITAGGAVEAIWTGKYADGVPRPHEFIAADQCYIILAMVCHSLAMFSVARAAWYAVEPSWSGSSGFR